MEIRRACGRTDHNGPHRAGARGDNALNLRAGPAAGNERAEDAADGDCSYRAAGLQKVLAGDGESHAAASSDRGGRRDALDGGNCRENRGSSK